MLRRSKRDLMSIFLILLALATLIAGAWRGVSVLVLAPALAMLAALASGTPVLAGYTQVRRQGVLSWPSFPCFCWVRCLAR